MKLGLISDVHEDIISLEKGLDLLHENKCDQIVCLGDITGFSPRYYPYTNEKNANACIELIRAHCSLILSGNHDLFTAQRVTAFRAGIEYPDNWFDLPYEERRTLLEKKVWLYEDEVLPDLTAENIAFLRSLPEYFIMHEDGYAILFSHFLYPDISGSLRKKNDDIADYRDHFLFMRKNNCILSFSGHMHVGGFEVLNRNGLRNFRFGKRKLKYRMTFIGLPSVARGRTKNGVTVFDTQSFDIKAIRIK
jgi:predicted phosphodiesterase